MPTYRINDPSTGKTIRLVGDSPPTEQELEEVFKSVGQSAPETSAMSAQYQAPQRTGTDPYASMFQAGSPQQLQAAVDDAGKIGEQKAVQGESGQYVTPYFQRPGVMTAPPSAATSEEEKKRTKEAAIQAGITAARVAPVAAAGMMTGGLGLIPTAMGMAGAGTVGEVFGQAGEYLTGQRKDFSEGQLLKGGVVSATPVLRPFQGTVGPLGAGLFQGSAQAGVNAATAAFGDALQKYIDQGRLPTLEEIGKEISLPAIFGFTTGGATGALARPARQLTAEEQIAQQGRQAGQRLEETLGAGTAPLTATQQTGRNVPGTFGPGSSGLAAQQALPERIRGQLGIPAQQERATAQVAQQEVLGAEAASRQALRGSAAGAGGQAVGEVEGVIGSILPRSPRAASLQDAANNSVGFIRGEDQRLSGIVDDAYTNARNALAARLSGQPEVPVAPSQNLRDTIDEVLGTLATEERITVTPSPIIGGTPTTTVERIPSQFFNEASSRARALLDVARSPQTFEQIVGLRQSVDGIIHQFQEFAPGVAQNQLRRLRSALKQEELASAQRLGIEADIVSAQRAAENRFNLLQDNQIIRRASIPAAEGGYQNTEQFFSDLASSPAGFESVRNLLTSTAQGRIQFDQIRRGFVDSLRGAGTVDIGGVPTESLSSFANNFRELPQGVRNIVAGNEANANRLQSILNDAVRTQNVGMSIPVATGISPQALTEITDNLGTIASPTLRNTVANLARQARDRAEEFFNTTTRRVQRNQLNPDVDPSQFVRDFVFRSENPQVVQNALNQLNPATRDAVRANAAVAVLNHVSETGPANLRRGIQNLDDIVQDPNRMQIIRDVLEPNDFNMINDYMAWNRARNLTAQGGRLQPDQLANSVMRATRARWVVDALVGSPTVQNFLSSAVRLPQTFANLKPNLTLPQAEALAKASNMSLLQFNREWDNLNKKSEEAKSSLPEDKRGVFEDTLGVPARPRF
jgi:hypothetical protein